ncbi:hypothetical protein MRB53_041353 [Persea americana]|nr:hypothetical protein MRB53_041353 [Persea americana]
MNAYVRHGPGAISTAIDVLDALTSPAWSSAPQTRPSSIAAIAAISKLVFRARRKERIDVSPPVRSMHQAFMPVCTPDRRCQCALVPGHASVSVRDGSRCHCSISLFVSKANSSTTATSTMQITSTILLTSLLGAVVLSAPLDATRRNESPRSCNNGVYLCCDGSASQSQSGGNVVSVCSGQQFVTQCSYPARLLGKVANRMVVPEDNSCNTGAYVCDSTPSVFTISG